MTYTTHTQLYQQRYQQLNQCLQRWEKQFQDKRNHTIQMCFENGLFTQNFETLDFYFTEIHRTLEHLSQLQANDTEKAHYLSEKIINQCAALREALDRQFSTPTKNVIPNIQNYTSREVLRQQIHTLPPRERLAKYYEALTELNLKIDQIQDRLAICPQQEQQHLSKQLEFQQKRRQKALNAIENLEEYLQRS